MAVTRLPRRIAAILAAFTLLAVAACGSPDPIEVLSAAADGAAAAGTVKARMTMEFDGEKITMDMVVSIDGRRALIDMHGMLPEPLEMRLLDGDAYLRIDGLPVNKEWVLVEVEDATGDLVMDHTAMGPVNPTEFLDALRDISSEVDELGTRTVDGDTWRGYRASLDVGTMFDTGVADGWIDPELAEQERDLLPDEFPVEVWIGSDGRPTRLTMEMEFRTPDGAASTVVMTLEYLAWDVPLDVAAPPADEVVDLSELEALGW